MIRDSWPVSYLLRQVVLPILFGQLLDELAKRVQEAVGRVSPTIPAIAIQPSMRARFAPIVRSESDPTLRNLVTDGFYSHCLRSLPLGWAA